MLFMSEINHNTPHLDIQAMYMDGTFPILSSEYITALPKQSIYNIIAGLSITEVPLTM
jgi:hypothetical protein